MTSILTGASIVIPLIVAIVTWGLNERSKRIIEEYQKKERRYIDLIESIRGFYIGCESKELKEKFLNQLNLCWLYCPDKVIQKAYAFLNTMNAKNISSDCEKEKALGELMLAIREDLISRKQFRKTKLKPEDFQILKAT